MCLFGAALAVGSCRGDVESESLGALTRLSPTTISNADAWALFDRSVSTGYKPDDRLVTVELGRRVPLSAVKVRGGSPYRVEVRGRRGASLGVAAIDLSTLAPGWHTITSSAVASTDAVELRFVATGAAAPVPELELWTVAPDAPSATADLSARTATDHIVPFAAGESAQQIDPGTCATSRVELTRPAAMFRRMHLAYDAIGLFRPFAIERSINGRAAVGGSWLRAEATAARSFIEEIDPASLTLGKNTLRFCVPAAATGPVTLSDVRIVGELDRGIDHVTKAAIGDRDGSAALDGRAETTVALAPGERMRLDLDRLVTPDALVMDGAANVARVDCIGKDGATSTLASEDIGGALRLEGGASACAALVLAVHAPVAITELDVVGSGAAERVDWPRLVVTSAAEHFGTFAWIGGFVVRPPVMSGAVRVEVATQSSDATTGEFGEVIKRTSDLRSAWAVDVAAHLPDGTTQTTKVVLDGDRAAELTTQSDVTATANTADASRYGALGAVATGKATLLADTKIRLGTHAGIDIPAGAVAKPTQIQARRLDKPTLPPLDPGMINVTAPQGQGYEFLPHGQRFAKNAEVIVPFEPRLIPEGMTTDDVHTYFYDETARRWRKLQRSSIDLGERTLRSTTDHFTIMINAVIAVPTSPTPLSFDPTALSSIAAASPAAGIDVIEPPIANSMGDARTGLPIRLPAGRGAYTPSLAISVMR